MGPDQRGAQGAQGWFFNYEVKWEWFESLHKFMSNFEYKSFEYILKI
jgi:hypothetical protein